MTFHLLRSLALVQAAVAFGGGLTSTAQESKQESGCLERANTQAAMTACADEEATRTDAELNDVYRALLKAASGEPQGVAKVTAAERAWTAYRDAYVEAMYPATNKQAEYGSIYPMEVSLLRASLTRGQVVPLKELLQHYTGAGQPGVATPKASPSRGR
jgi:uncharacterized protein YecT (DUF1311 family)